MSVGVAVDMVWSLYCLEVKMFLRFRHVCSEKIVAVLDRWCTKEDDKSVELLEV